jgi:hypothetical protein
MILFSASSADSCSKKFAYGAKTLTVSGTENTGIVDKDEGCVIDD